MIYIGGKEYVYTKRSRKKKHFVTNLDRRGVRKAPACALRSRCADWLHDELLDVAAYSPVCHARKAIDDLFDLLHERFGSSLSG